ncbi:helix-turn-helix domain-containing protein [candidate division WWE3 bacterium]|jgi:excisionase family DNA binding protein|nr:helix-turn-helix domain-containing protein [candidate division WWE3 bacterium]
MNTAKRYLNIKEASEYTSIPVKTLYEWAGIGKIPSIKIGRKVLFDIQDIDKAMDKLKRSQLQYEKTTNKIIGDVHGNSI